MTVINGKTLAEGESAKITLKGQSPVTVKCVKIEKDSVTVTVEGETAPRRLTMR